MTDDKQNVGIFQSLLQRVTGTIDRKRFESPRWIYVVYGNDSEHSGIQSGIKAAGYKLTKDSLRVTKAVQVMNESNYKIYDRNEIDKAWLGTATWEDEILVKRSNDN